MIHKKITKYAAAGALVLALGACSAENNDNDDLQNGNPAVDGNEEKESPMDEPDTADDLENDVQDEQEGNEEDREREENAD